jgi:hypothetical protein
MAVDAVEAETAMAQPFPSKGVSRGVEFGGLLAQ